MIKVNLNTKQRQQPSQTLNTKGCCFLCLKIINFKTEVSDDKNVSGSEPVSLKCLHHYLKINTKPGDLVFLNNNKTYENRNVEADLCKLCKRIISKFSKLFRLLEKTQMEIKYSMDEILRQITEASKIPEVVQNYSKRMTSDPETLTQLVFVDHFRKEIARKGSTKNAALLTEPRICLTQLRNVEKYLSRHRKPSPVPSLQEEDKNYDEDVQDDSTPLGDDGSILGLMSSGENEVENDLNFKPPQSLAFPSDSTFQITNVRSIHVTPKQSILTKSMYKTNKETGKYTCVVCKKEYGCQKGVWDHYNAFHLNKIHKCETCSAVFRYPQSLRIHKRICKRQLAQKEAKTSDPRYRFICKVCGKRFKYKGSVQEHERIVHLKQRNFPCDLCSKTFQYLADMQKHKDAVHLGKTWSCKICKKQFKWNTTRRRHEKICSTKPVVKTEILIEES